jgi:putative polyhydroxyalkanoate system protein
MDQPIVVTLPHNLGRAEARQRIAGGIGKLADHIPGGAQVASRWEGDRLTLDIQAMGQAVTGRIDVEDSAVRLEFTLPPMLAMFANQIRAFLGRKGTEMLEDKSKT